MTCQNTQNTRCGWFTFDRFELKKIKLKDRKTLEKNGDLAILARTTRTFVKLFLTDRYIL